jgi:hypothetical protein
MVDLAVVVARRLPVGKNHRVVGEPVTYAGHVLGQMRGGVRVVSDPEQEDLSVEGIDAANGTVQAMGDVHGMSRGDLRRLGADGRERMGAVAAEDSRHSPEGIRHHAHPEARSLLRIEDVIVIVRHAGHDQSSPGTQRGPERFDQTLRSTFHRGHFRECRMHDQDTAGLHSEGEELPGHLMAIYGLK